VSTHMGSRVVAQLIFPRSADIESIEIPTYVVASYSSFVSVHSAM
jgi:hypothetical protein